MRKLFFVLLCFFLPACTSKPERQSLESYLNQGKIADGITAYRDGSADPQAQFELGVLSTIESFRTFSASILKVVKRQHLADVPFAPTAPAEPVTYERFRGFIEKLTVDLRAAGEHLERGGSGAWKVVIRPQDIKVDLNGDGRIDPSEEGGELFSFGLDRALRSPVDSDTGTFAIAADAADSLWLAGYCNLLASILDVVLIYDLRPLYKAAAKDVFENAQDAQSDDMDPEQLLFIEIAVQDKAKGQSARNGFLKVLDLNQATMAALEAETDDDREWIPSAKQHSVTGISVDQSRWDSWRAFAKEFRQILEGDLLVPVPGQPKAGMGLNVKKLFQNPVTLGLNVEQKLDEYIEPASPEKILKDDSAFYRFLAGDGLLYAFFIN